LIGVERSGIDSNRAQLVIKQVDLRAEPRPEASTPRVHRFDLALSASLPSERQLRFEYWRREPGAGAASVHPLDETRLVAGKESGAVHSLQRLTSVELPGGVEEAAAQEAHRQIINGWLNQDRALRLDRPERLFEIELPGGSRLELVAILEAAPSE
jgi:hypothetical protein